MTTASRSTSSGCAPCITKKDIAMNDSILNKPIQEITASELADLVNECRALRLEQAEAEQLAKETGSVCLVHATQHKTVIFDSMDPKKPPARMTFPMRDLGKPTVFNESSEAAASAPPPARRDFVLSGRRSWDGMPIYNEVTP